MKLKRRIAHPAVPDVPELHLCNDHRWDYTAVEEAYNNAIDVEAVGNISLRTKISIAKSTGLGTDAEAKKFFPCTSRYSYRATAFDGDGKVAGTIIDNAQTKSNLTEERLLQIEMQNTKPKLNWATNMV